MPKLHFKREVVKNCPKLFELLNKCQNLEFLRINLLFSKEKLKEFALILKKFKDNLRHILFHFHSVEKFPQEVIDFLSECRKLECFETGMEDRRIIPDNLFECLKNSKYTLNLFTGLSQKKSEAFPLYDW